MATIRPAVIAAVERITAAAAVPVARPVAWWADCSDAGDRAIVRRVRSSNFFARGLDAGMRDKSAVKIKARPWGQAPTLNMDICLVVRGSHLCDQALERLVGLLCPIRLELGDFFRICDERLVSCLCILALKRHDIGRCLEAGQLRNEL